MALDDLLNFLVSIHPELPRLVGGALIVAVIGVCYKLLSRSINQAVERLEVDEHTQNSFRLILRVVTLVIASTLLFSLFELPTEWFLGGSALIGAVIGFGSSQTINNIAAGFYVILTRPFKVKDYVRIGDIEGQVEEISINYTKLYTPSFNLLLLPNTQVMNNKVLNCTHEGFIKYTFTLTFPHMVEITNEELAKECIEPSIEEFFVNQKGKQLRKPEYYFESSVPFGRSFKIRIFVPKGEAKTLYVLQPELAEEIMNRWDLKRLKR
jgi:small conductance mechanosensitive channel